MKTLTLALQFAGLIYIGILCAGATMPRVVDLRRHIATLPTFVGQVFWVYYAFIGLCLVGFGFITVVFAESLASATPLARAWCAFLALFWTLRCVVAALVFDVRPYLTNRWCRMGYAASNVAFILLPVIYALAALRPAWLE